MNNKRSGISLIVLIITIIIIIILAGAVILNLSKNNPIDNARIAKLTGSKDSLDSSMDLYLAKSTTSTLGNYTPEEIIIGEVEGIDSIVDSSSFVTLNGRKLYLANKDKVKEELGIDLPITSNPSKVKWYVDSLSGKFYLLYDSINDYESWLGEYDHETEMLDNQTLSSFVMTKTATEVVVKNNGIKYNKPNISSLPQGTTKAVKWDASNTETQISLDVANSDTSWYDYTDKKWANIITTNNGNKAYWVWIPRYAYKIDNPHTSTAQQIHIIFLSGTSNSPADGGSLPSGYIVHPAFTFGNTQLTGIWVAKFEASSSNPDKVETGGAMPGIKAGGGSDTSLQVRVLPSVNSWRNISAGDSQTVCMNMTNSNGTVGTNVKIDTHMMKNVEWGAVAYLCQSQYGQEPWINPYIDMLTLQMKTGYAGSSKDSTYLTEGSSKLVKYNTTNGVKASTTGNIYGVYDMSGGTPEVMAAFINNGSSYVTDNANKQHMQNGKIKTEYLKYYDIYEPTEEEQEGGAYHNNVTLWNSGNTEALNIIRKRLTDGTYAKFADHKGDAMWETSSITSYHGFFVGSEYIADLIDTNVTEDFGDYQYARGWNNDYMVVGCGIMPWIIRGGSSDVDSGAGIFSYGDAGVGQAFPLATFRPVLVTSNQL